MLRATLHGPTKGQLFLAKSRALPALSSRSFGVFSYRLNKDASSLDPAAVASTKIEIKIQPIPRPNEPTEKKRARLLYQCRKRGILETDLLLSRFAKVYLKDMTREELEEFDELLDEHDWDLYYWATESESAPKPCPEKWRNSAVFKKLVALSKNEDKEVLRMPPLH